MMLNKALIVLAGFTMACASAPSAGKPTRDTNVITREEIAGANVYNAYDAIKLLRPQYFHSHGPTTLSTVDTGLPKVYLNHQFYGDIESLRNLEVASIRTIHYYSGPEASSRFGMNNVSGAIDVVTDAQ
jgi:hypothetical protein